ncbi:hypothetical protein MNBD_ALPHA06-1172 [hydrothermal vent metagenome]|uniref:Uncharacterized protein n=1 Tax=hydrothermal vent metagenome TaxID=652676 RepID=A0A3B0RY98_9ZZZZ
MEKWTKTRIIETYDKMRDRSLPYAQWTHQAHIVVGLAFLDVLGLDGSIAQMPEAIRKYNVAVGNQNTATEGYHHTLTLLYLRALQQFASSHPEMDLSELVAAALSAPIAAKDWPLTYYSQQRLFSVEARAKWVEPDLLPLPVG